MEEPPCPIAFKTSRSCTVPFINTRLQPFLQQLLLCYWAALTLSDPLPYSTSSKIPRAAVAREPAEARCPADGSATVESTIPATADTSPPFPSSTCAVNEEDVADQRHKNWQHFLRLSCFASLGYNDVTEEASDVSHPSGYQSLHLHDVRRACEHCEQSNALWNLLRNHPSDAAYGLSFAHGLVRHLGLLQRVAPEEFLSESLLTSALLPKWYMRRTVGTRTSKPTCDQASSGALQCPCGCVRDGTIVDRMAFQFHSTYYKIHNPSEDSHRKLKAEEFSHPNVRNEGVGSAVFQQPHPVASLQIVPLPVLTVQILASFVQSIQSRYVPSYSLDPTGLGRASSEPVESHPREAYRSFFTIRERRVVVVACTLLAWKQLDVEADAYAFVLAQRSHNPRHASSSPRSREQSLQPGLNSLMMSEAASDMDILDAFIDFRCFCSPVMVTSFSRSPVDEIHEMEEYVFTNLKGCVGAPPLWWRVAIEIVQLYYCGVRLKGQYALSCFCHHVDSPATEGLRQHYQYAIKRLANRAMALLLLPTLLDITDEDDRKNVIRHSDPPIVTTLQGEHPTQRFSGTSIDSRRSTEDSKILTLRQHLMSNPLLGFGLAIHCDAVPANWALRLITLRPCNSLFPAEQGTTRSDEVSDANQHVTSELQKLCGEIQRWFEAVNGF